MTRKKVRLAYIANDSERKASFKKRKRGLLKKVSELSTLCDVDACAIIFSPFEREPEVWPSHLGVQRVLAKFRRMTDLEQNRKMVNQETYTRERIRKAEEQLRKQNRENRRKEVGHIINQCLAGATMYQNFAVMDLNDMGWILNQNLREINMRIESLKGENPPQGPNPSQGPNPPQGPITTSGMYVGESSNMYVGESSNMYVGESSNMYVGESSNQVNMAAEIPQNEMQNFQWDMEMPTLSDVQPGMGWDDTLLPYAYNNDAPGPSFT